jgi:hypothetical protein
MRRVGRAEPALRQHKVHAGSREYLVFAAAKLVRQQERGRQRVTALSQFLSGISRREPCIQRQRDMGEGRAHMSPGVARADFEVAQTRLRCAGSIGAVQEIYERGHLKLVGYAPFYFLSEQGVVNSTAARIPAAGRRHHLVAVLRHDGIGMNQFQRLALFERRFLAAGSSWCEGEAQKKQREARG